MTKRTLGEIPEGCRHRILTHYGPAAQPWLETVPALLEQAAKRWMLSLGEYHDAGHASIIATATASNGHLLLLKAWPDPGRYRRELDVLRLWKGGPTADVVEVADELAVAALELVGGQTGGASRPPQEMPMVAEALHTLHAFGRRLPRPSSLPLLSDYVALELLPRIERRSEELQFGDSKALVQRGLCGWADLDETPGRSTVLHADLYRENVLFDSLGDPRLIDPLPMVGDAVFDWAFWIIYYNLGIDTADRLATASRVSRVPVRELVPWCRLLAVDGFLFYRETDDARAPRMAGVLSEILTSPSRSGS